MKKHLVCIKIGGSVITDKSKPFTADAEAMDIFAKNMAAAIKTMGDDTSFLLGNGAGSFGHVPAHEYGLDDGARGARQQYGLAFTHNCVRDLNLQLGKVLNSYLVPATCLSPGDILITRHGTISSGNTRSVSYALKNKLIPVLHGDGAYDEAKGLSIVSTERSLLWFADTLHKSYEMVTVIAITNTGGVLDASGSIIQTLRKNDIVVQLKSGGHDVTGSMAGKVQSLRIAAEKGYTSYIIGNNKKDLLAAIHHEPAGTQVM